MCSITEVFRQLTAALIPWSALQYRRYDVNVTVNVPHKGGYWNCGIRIIRIWKVQQPEEYSYEQPVKQ